MKRNGAKRWPLGFGILYLMVNFPLVVFWKTGITGVGVMKRAKGIDLQQFSFGFLGFIGRFPHDVRAAAFY